MALGVIIIITLLLFNLHIRIAVVFYTQVQLIIDLHSNVYMHILLPPAPYHMLFGCCS